MILSIGIDIVEVYRIRDTIARTPRFAERVFTAAERKLAGHGDVRIHLSIAHTTEHAVAEVILEIN
jgi:phosphopantetheinyl transferase (holo-ACP synthase)